MYKLVLSEKELAARMGKIPILLKPLLPNDWRPVVSKSARSDEVTYTATGKKSNVASRDLRFKTKADSVVASYFETYLLRDGEWLLSKAYLMLFKKGFSGNPDIELCALHCDPMEKDDVSQCKRGPHIHIKASDAPLPRAHLALNRHHLDEVCSSYAQLLSAFESGLVILSQEILQRY
jgi:hypothetical protein